jgi:glutaredoxin
MDIQKPSEKNFTIYTKSGCSNCLKLKNILKEKKIFFNTIDCDEYLIENKSDFLLFFKETYNKDIKQFPIVFNDAKFIGGYEETIDYINKLFLIFEEFIIF